MLRAILKDDTSSSAVGVTTEIKAVFKQTLISKVFEQGGGIFVPKHTKEGTTNQLTGLLSECKGLAEGTWDARHENLEGIGLLPAETRDGAVLPIILEMINAGQIAPVVSSEEAGQDTIVYLQGIQGREHVKIGIYRGAMRCLSACICREVRCKVWRERVP